MCNRLHMLCISTQRLLQRAMRTARHQQDYLSFVVRSTRPTGNTLCEPALAGAPKVVSCEPA